MSGEKLSVELEIKNRKGLHARAAAAFVKAIENLDARVEVERIGQAVFVSATPGPYERERADQVVEQVIRPTGLLLSLIHI